MFVYVRCVHVRAPVYMCGLLCGMVCVVCVCVRACLRCVFEVCV